MSCVVRKPAFCLCENKTQISFTGTAKLISAFVFATLIVQSLYFLNTKFQASSHFVWLYSLVCAGPGRKPRRPVFSQQGSYCKIIYLHKNFSYDDIIIIFKYCTKYYCYSVFLCRYIPVTKVNIQQKKQVAQRATMLT